MAELRPWCLLGQAGTEHTGSTGALWGDENGPYLGRAAITHVLQVVYLISVHFTVSILFYLNLKNKI